MEESAFLEKVLELGGAEKLKQKIIADANEKAAQILKEAQSRAQKTEKPNKIFNAESKFFKLFGKPPDDIFELYGRLRLSIKEVIELEQERLSLNEKAGHFLPQWKKVQIIQKTLELLGLG